MIEAKINRLHGPKLNRKLEIARQILYFIGVGLNATFWQYSRNFVIWYRRLCPEGVILQEDKFFNIGFADNFFAIRFEFEHCNKWFLKRQNIDPKCVSQIIISFTKTLSHVPVTTCETS